MRFVQVGAVTSAPAIAGAVDLRGKTSFRDACLVLKRARLFIGTESGLMHASNAVGAHALILWGGLTLPEFIGYPQRQRTLCKYVACAPCGNNGWCDNGRICMTRIGVDEALDAANEMLEAA
jgi:ADP-heptose:LPS heptosyltransferase